jgi:hypothetical protein
VAIVRDGRVAWSGAFGTVNDSTHRPLDAETGFEGTIGSGPWFCATAACSTEAARPESPLLPMGADLFELERDPAVRVRFVGDGSELVALYRDGSIDRWSWAR